MTMTAGSKGTMRKILITIAVVFSLGGAVNSGWSYFVPAIPFMLYLVVSSYRVGQGSRIASLVFVALCIATSLTRDYNPLIYPILWDGEVTVLEDGYHINYSDRSGNFYTPDDALDVISSSGAISSADAARARQFILSSDGPDSLVIASGYTYYENNDYVFTRLARGDQLPVTGIVHNHADFGSTLALETPLGQMGRYRDWIAHDTDENPGIQVNKPVQAKWASIVSNYPLLLIVMLVTNPLLGLAILAIIIGVTQWLRRRASWPTRPVDPR